MTELFSSKWKFDHLLPSCKGKLTVITVAAHFNEVIVNFTRSKINQFSLLIEAVNGKTRQ